MRVGEICDKDGAKVDFYKVALLLGLGLPPLTLPDLGATGATNWMVAGD